MKKYLIISLLIFAPILAKADTTVYGFMNGLFYDPTYSLQNPRFGCLPDGNCYDYKAGQNTTLSQILGLSTSTPQTLTITAGNPPADICANIEGIQTGVPDGLIQDGANCVVPQISISPATPAPTPAVTSNVNPSPSPMAQNLLPAYTQDELVRKLNVKVERDGFIFDTSWPAYISPASPTSARCDGSGPFSANIKLQFDGATVWDGSLPFGGDNNVQYGNNEATHIPGITGLAPNTAYQYQLVYHEDGREDSVVTHSFKTPAQ